MRLQFGSWEVECLPDDGARLSLLRFDGRDLLTGAPVEFRPPLANYGQYETRPVYGYDDCFPTVDACEFPIGDKFAIPDHGELCWLDWNINTQPNQLICQVRSKILPITFKRSMTFGQTSLKWEFEISNESEDAIPFLHVMHPLMPLENVADIHLPEFDEVFDGMNSRVLPRYNAADVTGRLLKLPGGNAEMLLLRKIKSGSAEVIFKGGLGLTIKFPVDLFPTFGIWWNNGGYPDEDGCRRVECALKPIPGTLSSLAGSYHDGAYLFVPANERLNWTITWKIKE